MESDPINKPDFSLEQVQDTVISAAQHIAELLAKAPQEERIGLVKALEETLNDADVTVIDTSGSDESERKGKHHPALTRPKVIALIKARERRWRLGRPNRISTWHDLS